MAERGVDIGGESDRLVDLVREGVDCVLRGGGPVDSNLVRLKIADLDEVACASPEYLNNFGIPNILTRLKGAKWLIFAQRLPEV